MKTTELNRLNEFFNEIDKEYFDLYVNYQKELDLSKTFQDQLSISKSLKKAAL